MQSIVHIDMDAFFCAVECLKNPELRGKPIIVGGTPQSKRSVVSSCSYEARKFGVHSAMPLQKAVELCPKGIFIPVDMPAYIKVSEKIHAVFQRIAPVVEPISIDEAFLDMTGCEHLYGGLDNMARSIQEAVYQEVKCTCSVGVAPNKFLAKLASDFKKPQGITVINSEDIDEFLLPLSIQKMWGVGEKTAHFLHQQGVQTVGDLRSKSQEWLETNLGKWGRVLYELVRGIDNRPVEPPGEAKSIGHEVTFPADIPWGDMIEGSIMGLVDTVAWRLRRDGRYARTVTVKVRYQDFSTFSKSKTLAQASFDSSIFLKTSLDLLRSFSRRDPVRLLGVYLSNLTKDRQLNLFADPRDSKKEKLLRDLNAGYSNPRVYPASSLLASEKSKVLNHKSETDNPQ